jgi:acetyltransferase-like isoleucine patch superfamily enzyme
VRVFDRSRLTDCQLGAYSYVSFDTRMQAVTAGRYCSIADNCNIGPAQHPMHSLTSSPIPYHDIFRLGEPLDLPRATDERIEIGHDVWVGAKAAVMGGVRIGHGSVVALGAVVTKDVPPYAVVAGVPAGVIKYRFPEATIARLLDFKWWRYDLLAVRRLGITISWQDPERALDELQAAELAGRVQEMSFRATTVTAPPPPR